MPGLPAITTHFLRSWHIMLTRMGALVTFTLPLSSDLLILLIVEELLIDFQELIGEHSGENMAEAVWGTLKRYGLERRVSHS